MYSLKIYPAAPNDWDKVVMRIPEGTIYQTTKWAEYMCKYYCASSFFVRILRKDDVILQCVIFLHGKYQETLARNRLTNKLLRYTAHLSSTLFWMDGPIVTNKAEILPVSDLFKKIVCYLKNKTHARSIYFNFPYLCSDYSKINFSAGAKEWGTFVIRNCSTDELWKKLNKGLRKNISRTLEKGVQVQIGNSLMHTQMYAKLLSEYKRFNYLEVLNNISIFKKSLKNNFYFAIALYKNKPIGAISFTCFNGIIHERGVARTDYEKQKKLYIQDLLKWKIIELMFSKGNHTYDLTGVNPRPANAKEAGIFKYKSKWGGTLVTYNLINSK